MKIDIMTLFPEVCEAFLSSSIIGRARSKGILDIKCHQIRDFAFDKHKRVDDTPYGGGKGMVMMAEPIFKCFENICELRGSRPVLIYMTPKGEVFNQKMAVDLKNKYDSIAILCGHYEGVDQRVIDEIVDKQISVGDYVLTGGEIPAVAVVDTICRMVPKVLSENVCFEDESHYKGLLEYPQYTKPAVWHDKKVPDVLISGHHANIEEWKRKKSFEETRKYRPDILKKQY